LRRIRAWFFRIAGIFREESRDRELAAEMESHLQLHIEDNLRDGMSAEEARRQALIRLGGIEQTKEAYRERRGLPMLETLLQDLRFAARMLRKNLGITVIVVLTLALGVGANTAIFGLVNGLLLQRLPVPAAEQIAALVIQSGDSSLGALGFSYPQFVEFREQTAPFCEVFGSATAWRLNFTAEGHSDTLTVGDVSSNYFSAFSVRPALGRLVLPGEGEHPGDPAILVLSYSFWQRRFGGDPQVIGKQVRMGGKPVTIVGVMEKEFRGQFSVFDMDAYAPLSTAFDKSSAINFWNSRDMHSILALGRLKPGVTIAQAQSRFDVISRRLAVQYPVTDRDLTVRVMDERLSRPIPYANNAFIVFSGLFLALGALVLLLACTNIANILMARASVRQREMAIRAALGGARYRLVRQMLTETMLTALLGGIAGVALGAGLSHLASSSHLANIPVRLGFGFDWRVFIYALAAVVFTAMAAGLSPALRATRADVNTVLHQGGRVDAGGKARHKVRGDLMAAQVAGSLMLLIVAGLFVRSLRAVEHMDIGFDPNQLLNVRLDPSINNLSETQTEEFYRSLETKIRALPGVQSASMASAVPIAYTLGKELVYVEERPVPPSQKAPDVMFNSVDTPYFETLRIRVLLGRAFMDGDSETSPRVAIINETMARHFWPNENPIGKRFSLTSDAGPFVEIVGVARRQVPRSRRGSATLLLCPSHATLHCAAYPADSCLDASRIACPHRSTRNTGARRQRPHRRNPNDEGVAGRHIGLFHLSPRSIARGGHGFVGLAVGRRRRVWGCFLRRNATNARAWDPNGSRRITAPDSRVASQTRHATGYRRIALRACRSLGTDARDDPHASRRKPKRSAHLSIRRGVAFFHHAARVLDSRPPRYAGRSDGGAAL